MGYAPVAQYGQSDGFLSRIMVRTFLVRKPVNTWQLLAKDLVESPSESWLITHYSRPFPVIVVLRLCWKARWTWRT